MASFDARLYFRGNRTQPAEVEDQKLSVETEQGEERCYDPHPPTFSLFLRNSLDKHRYKVGQDASSRFLFEAYTVLESGYFKDAVQIEEKCKVSGIYL
ncbi:unnamed protein product [Xylocopa violacea]|uniref:Uncharacterized protein n=1 Tax=Xylocopa violacea TaxID=135666 RepID=A0ABP1PCH3_XYLVO